MACSFQLCHTNGVTGKTAGWTVTTQVKNGKVAEHAEEFDFVVLATGSFLIPRIPNIKVMHKGLQQHDHGDHTNM